MNLEYIKRRVAPAWILGAGLVGLAANVSSIPASVILAVLGFGPPLIMLMLWHEPPQTVSESIEKVLR